MDKNYSDSPISKLNDDTLSLVFKHLPGRNGLMREVHPHWKYIVDTYHKNDTGGVSMAVKCESISMIEHYNPPPDLVCAYIIKAGNMELLKWAVERYPLNDGARDAARATGNVAAMEIMMTYSFNRTVALWKRP